MLIKLTDIVSDGLHGLILCTFFFITEAEIDASGLDGLGKGGLPLFSYFPITLQKITATPVLTAVARMAGNVMAAGFTLPYWLR